MPDILLLFGPLTTIHRIPSNNSSSSWRVLPSSTFSPRHLWVAGLGESRTSVCYSDPHNRKCHSAGHSHWLVQEWSFDQSCPMKGNVRTFVCVIGKKTCVFLPEKNVPRPANAHYYHPKGKSCQTLKPIHRKEIGAKTSKSEREQTFLMGGPGALGATESPGYVKLSVLWDSSVELFSKFCLPLCQFTLGFSWLSTPMTTMLHIYNHCL